MTEDSGKEHAIREKEWGGGETHQPNSQNQQSQISLGQLQRPDLSLLVELGGGLQVLTGHYQNELKQ